MTLAEQMEYCWLMGPKCTLQLFCQMQLLIRPLWNWYRKKFFLMNFFAQLNIPTIAPLSQFHCLNHSEVGPQHTATTHIGFESMEEIILACQDAYNDVPSRRLVMEMTIPSSLDNTISPPGKHVISLFTQYTPYKPSDGSWDNAAYRESYAERCFNLIDEYAPGFCSSVIGYDMLTSPDLEREIGLTGGNIFHGAMGLDSRFLMRPVKGWSNHKTPIRDLYLCGSGSHPGGGVMGAPGRNAAHVVLQDLKNRYQ